MSKRGLPDPGDVLEEDMPAREERRDGETYDLFFTVEHFLDFADQPLQKIERPWGVRYGRDIGQITLHPTAGRPVERGGIEHVCAEKVLIYTLFL